MKNKKGFTLAEVMVTLVIMGVLAAILVPAVMNVSPDSNKVLLKKAYSTTEKVVSELINDDSNYPVDQTGTTTDTSQTVPLGFTYTTAGGTTIPVGDNKFCFLFSENLNTVGAVDCNPTGGMSFTTADGMVWTPTATAFILTLDATSYLTTDVLSVDVTGSGKGDNCFYNTCAAGKHPDKFRFRIRYDGKMTIDPADTAAISILTNPTDNQKD